MSCFFITATDTDAGKTFITSMLLHEAGLQKKKTLGFKPIASGMETQGEKKINQDVELLKCASTITIPDASLNPYLFEQAIAPHIAADLAKQTIDLDSIKTHINRYRKQADFVLVEGVGGWEVPLNNSQGIPDLAKMLDMPVVIVVKIKTGCINHAILTINAIRQSGLTIAGWVANQADDTHTARENIRAIENRSGISCLAKIPQSEHSSYQQQYNFIASKNQSLEEISQLYQKLINL